MEVIELLQNDLKATKKQKEDLIVNWQLNVNERRGKDFQDAADENRSMVPMDWTLTKTKAAQLWSQMPQVRLMPRHKAFADAVPVAGTIINDLLTVANVEAVLSESVVDCVNAAGVAAALVYYESLTDMTPLPVVDPIAMAMASVGQPQAPIEDPNQPLPTVDNTRTTDRRFCVDRISPGDFLWPVHFRSSNWDKAPWLGHTCREPWAKAKRLLGLKDEDKEKVVGKGGLRREQDLSMASEQERKAAQQDMVEYDQIFYYRHFYHEDEKYYDSIQRVVFVTGLDEPIINEPWKGQQFDEKTGTYIGSCKLPIRVLTLNYISDEAIPPSDSAIIRPQVKELQQSRQDMKEQRKHSKPLRWFNVDLVDPGLTSDLIKGTWQGMIPVNTSGDRAIGEVARTAFPRENLEFDAILKKDIQEAVSVGPNQSGQFATGERSAREAQIVQNSFQTEIGWQRARVAAYFTGIAEVLFGLWALFGEVEPLGIGASIGPDGMQKLDSWDRKSINQKFVAEVRVDSTVRLDAKDVIDQVMQVLNVTAQSGFINPKPLIRKILDAAGIDPAEVLVDPKPKGPEPPKINYTFKGEDLMNPIVCGIIAASGQAPTPEQMEAGKMMMMSSQTPPVPKGAAPGTPPPPPGQMKVTDPQLPEKPFQKWEAAPRINTRRSEG